MLADRFDPRYFERDVLFRYHAGWAGFTYSRNSPATYFDRTGTLREVGPDAPRIEWYDLDGDGVRETPTLLMEPGATNLIPQSASLHTWLTPQNTVLSPTTLLGLPAVRIDGTAEEGGRGATRNNDLIGSSEAVATYSLYLRAHPDIAAVRLGGRAGFFPSLNATLDIDLRTLDITLNDSIGTFVAAHASRIAPDLYRVEYTIANESNDARRRFMVAFSDSSGAFTGGSAAGLWIEVAGLQIEATPYATSPIITTGVPGTRAADVLTFPWPDAPQAMTGYLRLVCRTVATGSVQTLFQIGTGSDEPRLIVMISSAGRPRCEYRRSDTEVALSEADTGQVNFGNLLEVLWRLRQDGRVQIEHSIDHAPPIVANVSSAAPVLADAWSGPIAGLSARPVTFDFPAPAAWRDVVVLRGADWTMDDVRRYLPW